MVITKTILLKISKQNIGWYKKLGYEVKLNELIEVKYDDLPKQSKIIVEIQCDYCELIFPRTRSNHYKQTSNQIINKDSCTKCAGLKRKESNLLIYGVSSPMKLDTVKNKQKQVMMDKYGVEHQMHLQSTKDKIKSTNINKYGVAAPSQSSEIMQKMRNTNLLRYGVDNYTKTDAYKKKVKETNLKKYGVENVFQNKDIQKKQEATVKKVYGVSNVFQNEDIKSKSRKTLLKKYGVEHPMHLEQIKSKVNRSRVRTLYKNGTTQVSKQQKYLNTLLGGELNYVVDHLNLDIAFPDEKIYIEYNGGGHDLQVKMGRETQSEFSIKERKRYFFLKSLGWKLIEINSPRDYLPADTIIMSIVQAAQEYFELGNSYYKVVFSEHSFDNDYGKLRKI